MSAYFSPVILIYKWVERGWGCGFTYPLIPLLIEVHNCTTAQPSKHKGFRARCAHVQACALAQLHNQKASDFINFFQTLCKIANQRCTTVFSSNHDKNTTSYRPQTYHPSLGFQLPSKAPHKVGDPIGKLPQFPRRFDFPGLSTKSLDLDVL